MSNYIVVDLETSGLDPEECSILSIGAVKRKTSEEFYGECQAWTDADISEGALKVNGFTMDQVYDSSKETEYELLKRFFNWVGNSAVLIGMNPYFDYSFLRSAAKRAGIKNPFNHRTLDMHTLAIAYAILHGYAVPEKGLYTDAIYNLLCMDPEPKPHNALTGAKMENVAFTKLFYALVKR